MTYRANTHEAKTHFSELMRRAHAGEEVIVAKAGRDYVRIVPIRDAADRTPGAFKGKISGDPLRAVASDDSEPWG